MKTIFAVLATGLAISFFCLRADKTAPASSEKELAASAVRGMASFLEASDAVTRPAPAAEARSAASQPAAAAPESAADSTQEGIGKVEETERRISAHYPQTENGALIRHYVALMLNDVDTDFRPELNRVRTMRNVMRNAGPAADDLSTALGSLEAGEEGSEAERAALLSLAGHVGANQEALPAVEGILSSELSRHAELGLTANQTRLVQLVDTYTKLVSDPVKQAEFVRAGIQAQDDPAARKALETCLEGITNRTDISQAQTESGGAS